MRQHILAALVFALPAAADDLSQCPAPIDLGPWGGQVTQSQANIFVKDGNVSGVLTGPVDVSEDFADFKDDPCSPGFTAEGYGPDGRLFRYEMEFAGWSIEPFDNMISRPQRTGESNAAYRERLAVKPMRTYPIYEAEWKGHPQMTIYLRMVFLGTDSGVSQSEMRFTSGKAIGRAQPIIAMRAMQPSATRYECRCRAKLDAWLKDKIDEAELWQRAYGKKA